MLMHMAYSFFINEDILQNTGEILTLIINGSEFGKFIWVYSDKIVMVQKEKSRSATKFNKPDKQNKPGCITQ